MIQNGGVNGFEGSSGTMDPSPSFRPPSLSQTSTTTTTISTPPSASTRHSSLRDRDHLGKGISIDEDGDGFLGVVSRWGTDDDGGGVGLAGSRMSKMGLSPPPPPGPPPSEPPPLPPAPISTHPFAIQASGSRQVTGSAGNAFSRAAGKISAVNAFRRAGNRSTASTSVGEQDHTALPSERQSQEPSYFNTTGQSTTTPPVTPTNPVTNVNPKPTISPRSSSLMSPAQINPIHKRDNSQAESSRSAGIGMSRESSSTGKSPRTPSRHLLQTALDLAQRAVEMDKNNDVVGALAAYREAVTRLKSVMERVGVEPDTITGDDGKRRKNSVGKSDEEGRTLRGIHDAYVARIALLANYDDSQSPPETSPGIDIASASTSTATLVPKNQQNIASTHLRNVMSDAIPGEPIPRPSLDDTGVMGIGNLMMTDRNFDSAASSPRVSAQIAGPSRLQGTAPIESLGRPIDGQPRSQDSFSLQQISGDPNRGTMNSVRSSISSSVGFGRTSSEGVRYQSSRPGSREGSSRHARKPSRPSVGLDMEADLSGIDGVVDTVEMLDSTGQTGVNGVGPSRSREGDLKGIPGGSNNQGPQSPWNAGDERPLPPLPISAPMLDGVGRPLLAVRKASLGATTSPPPRPPSGSFLVSPTTAEGTISRRRSQRPSEVNGLGSISSLLDVGQDKDPVPFPKNEPPSSRSVSSAQSPPPQSSSTSSSTWGRMRAKSESSRRPSQTFKPNSAVPPGTASSGIPPVPSVRKKPSFGMLKVNTSIDSNGLAPPATIHPKSHLARRPEMALLGVPSGSGSLISPLPEEQPTLVIHRPFHLLRILYHSMDPESSGSYLTGAIHISSAVWRPHDWVNGGSSTPSSSVNSKTQPPKIAAQEVKAKVIEALVGRFEDIREKGKWLLEGPREEVYSERKIGVGSGNGKGVEEFCAALDGLEDEMENSVKALIGKGVVLGNWKGKKTGVSGLSWGSRISRSMDKMTNGKNLDSPDRYVDLLSALCYNAQIINDHLENFTGPCTQAYQTLSSQTYERIQTRITRSAEFIAAVVVPFILDDLKQFFLRYLKSGVKYLEE